MELKGRLLYVSSDDVSITCRYVVYNYGFWHADLVAIIRTVADIPATFIDRIIANVTTVVASDSLDGASVKLSELLAQLPPMIYGGADLLRESYLQGGSTQYFTIPFDAMIGDAVLTPYVGLAVLSGLTEVNAYLTTGVTVRYYKYLTPAMVLSTPTNYVSISALGGAYRVICPSITRAQAYGVFGELPVAFKHTTSPYASVLSMRSAAIFTNPPSECCPGLYFCSDSEIGFNEGVDGGTGLPDPFFYSSTEYGFSPFNADFPAGSSLSRNHLYKHIIPFAEKIVWGDVAGTYGRYSLPNDEIYLSPTIETVRGFSAKGGVTPEMISIFLYLLGKKG